MERGDGRGPGKNLSYNEGPRTETSTGHDQTSKTEDTPYSHGTVDNVQNLSYTETYTHISSPGRGRGPGHTKVHPGVETTRHPYVTVRHVTVL